MRATKELFDLSDVLGLRKHLAALVLNGRLFRLVRAPMSSAEPEFAELFGARRRVEAAGRVKDLFVQTLHENRGETRAFQSRCLKIRPRARVRVPAELKRRLDLHARLRFVFGRLIPKLRKLAGSGGTALDRSGAVGELRPLDGCIEKPAGLDGIPADLAEQVLGKSALVLGQNAFEVKWIPGDHTPRNCFLQAEGERYSVQTGARRNLMSLDSIFKKRLRESLKGHIFEAENDRLLDRARMLEEDLRRATEVAREDAVLYRDRERCVIMDRERGIFCCQEVPSFAMESPRRTLHLFDRVRVGVKLSSLAPEEVLSVGAARMMESYSHLFVPEFVGNSLCMGGDYRFFQRFWTVPLEEGIVEYLNAARLVLCAGYYEGADAVPYDAEAIHRRPRIRLKEAVARGLPVYRYYRK